MHREYEQHNSTTTPPIVETEIEGAVVEATKPRKRPRESRRSGRWFDWLFFSTSAQKLRVRNDLAIHSGHCCGTQESTSIFGHG